MRGARSGARGGARGAPCGGLRTARARRGAGLRWRRGWECAGGRALEEGRAGRDVVGRLLRLGLRGGAVEEADDLGAEALRGDHEAVPAAAARRRVATAEVQAPGDGCSRAGTGTEG